MSDSAVPTPHPRAQTRRLIEDMLRERQQMLVLLWELTKQDFSDADNALVTLLDDFEDVLVDYIAAGHFGLYQRLGDGSERRQPVLDVAREIYPSIVPSTDTAMAFSERYERPSPTTLQERLAQDLSRLAEALSTRIELEDRLILAMLGQDYTLPTPPGPG